jgi:hypothetical protein
MKYMQLVAIVIVAASVGCNGADRSSIVPITAPTSVQPPAPAVPSPESVPNWRADALVISASGGSGGCGWGRTPGEKAEKAWRITVDGDAVTLDEDLSNWPTDDVPYRGTLDGGHFTATVQSSPDYLNYACQWRGGTLTGEFNSDFTTFEADEIVVWGPPGRETTVRRHWVGSRTGR